MGNDGNRKRLYFGGLQNHWIGDRSHEIKRHVLLRRKALTNLDSILKSRDVILPTKVHLVKAMFFPVVMYGCESRTTKKDEHQRIDAFELWCWRRRVPWTARRSNQSILKEISPEYSLERLMPKLKLQNFGHLMQRTDSLEKILVLDWRQEKGMTEDEMVAWHRWLDGYEFEQTPGVGDREAWHAAVHGTERAGHDWVTELNWIIKYKTNEMQSLLCNRVEWKRLFIPRHTQPYTMLSKSKHLINHRPQFLPNALAL